MLKHIDKITFTLFFCGILFLNSCNTHSDVLTKKQRTLVSDSIQKMMTSIEKDISHDGPVAWIRYFSGSPDFFMVSDGQIVFPTGDSATHFINNTLVKIIPKIVLHWSNVRIDPIIPGLASIGATFHEDLTDASGKRMPQDGYFTAIAQKTEVGWKLRNAHWSSKNAIPK